MISILLWSLNVYDLLEVGIRNLNLLLNIFNKFDVILNMDHKYLSSECNNEINSRDVCLPVTTRKSI